MCDPSEVHSRSKFYRTLFACVPTHLKTIVSIRFRITVLRLAITPNNKVVIQKLNGVLLNSSNEACTTATILSRIEILIR